MDADERTRELLRSYGERAAPSPDQRERTWAAIAAAVAASPAGGAAPASANLALKAALGAGALIAVGIAAWAWTHDDAPSVRETPTVTAAADVPREEASAPVDSPAAPLAVATDAPSVPDELALPAPSPPRPALRQGEIAERPADQASTPSPAETPGTLAAELALMDTARAALARNDVAATLAALDEHETRFPTGTLASERDVVRVTALCAAGRDAEAALAAAAAGPRPAITRALSRCDAP